MFTSVFGLSVASDDFQLAGIDHRDWTLVEVHAEVKRCVAELSYGLYVMAGRSNCT